MSASIFNSLLNMVDTRTTGEIAEFLGQPTQAVSQAMQPTIAALLSGLASKSENPGVLRSILDTVPGASWTGLSGSQLTTAASDPNSSWMTAGKHLLSALFGGAENTVTNSIGRASGLSPVASGTLLTMVVPTVISFIRKHVSDTGMNMSGLADLLQREAPTFRSALPSGLSDVFPPVRTSVTSESPVIAQVVQRETSPNWLLPALAAAVLALGFVWLLHSLHRPVTHVSVVHIGGANRFGVPASNLTCRMPAGVTLPEGGTASRLLAIAQDGTARLSTDTWFNSDQVTFDSGSAKLKPGSQSELNDIASVLANCPNVRMTIAGYTDSVGNPEANLRLARSRANTVVAQLVSRGAAPDQLVAVGYGEKDPVADNATTEGRVQNRRVAMRVTQR